MTMPTNTPDPAAEGTASGAPATGGQPAIDWETDANPYKKRFAGLQAKYQTDAAQWQAGSTKLFDATEQLKALTGDHEALRTQFAALDAKEKAAAQELAGLKVAQERTGIIVKEFPDLLGLEADGLLPSDTGDALRGKLTAMRGKLGELGKQQAAAALGAGTPPASQKPDPVPAGTLLQQAMAAMKQGNMAEYDRLYGAYLAESNK